MRNGDATLTKGTGTDMAVDLGQMMAAYILEKQGSECAVTAEGFIVYQILKDGVLHVNNIYVKPEFRKTKLGSKIMDKVINEVAKERNIRTITASCDHGQLNPETSMQGILGYRHKSGYRFRIVPEVKQTNFFMELDNG